MRNRRLAGLTSALLAILLAPELSAAPVRVRITRYASMQPRGADVLSFAMANIWGGVVLQAQATFRIAGTHPIRPEEISLGSFDPEKERLCISYRSTCFFYDIREESLARAFSWVENGGTGLYTALSVSPNRAKRAGLSKSRMGGYIATEFAGSDLEEVAEYMDFPDLVEDVDDADTIMARLNRGLPSVWSEGADEEDYGDDLTYVVSDLDSHFEVMLRNGRATAKGTLYMYSREHAGQERVRVTAVDRLAEGSRAELQRRIREEFGEDDAETARLHSRALYLAQLVAVLRTVFAHNRTSWENFANAFFESP